MYWMDLVDHVTTVNGVMVLANADRAEYQFLVNGAVCARQSYCGIRVGQDEPDYSDHLAEIFAERARYAQRTHANGIGPVYV